MVGMPPRNYFNPTNDNLYHTVEDKSSASKEKLLQFFTGTQPAYMAVKKDDIGISHMEKIRIEIKNNCYFKLLGNYDKSRDILIYRLF